MNFTDFEKREFQLEIKNLVEKRDNFNGAEDCYCALMKQIFLSKSSLN